MSVSAWVLVLASGTAGAAEVVWLEPPSDALRSRVARQAGSSEAQLTATDLRAAGSRWSEADAAAYRTLEATLAEVRSYETKLDGELLIMRDLERPISEIGLVRDEADRARLREALAYQGFAVNRYFDTALGEDAEAEPYRLEIRGEWVERPWVNAVALDPTWEVTPYEIAEAPQRVAFARVQENVRAALPATVVPGALPDGAELVVDGLPARLGPTGSLKLVPGRHLLHADLDGRVVGRWDLVLAPGDEATVDLPLDDATWDAFLGGLTPGGTLPEALVPCVAALGGEVWLARPVSDDDAQVFALFDGQVLDVEIEKASGDGAAAGGLSAALALTGGWFMSGDFYAQDPANAPHDRDTVNALAVAVTLEGAFDAGPMRLGVGLDMPRTFGEHHVALSGENAFRVRFHPHAAIGVKWLQATVGFVFPYHPAVGARLALPLPGPFEVRGIGLFGPGGEVAYDAVSSYDRRRLHMLALGAGVRI